MNDEALNPFEGEESDPQKGSFRMDLYFWMQALAVALVALILTFTLAGRVIKVVGDSMLPTLHENDLMLLQSIGYTPKQGDIVVLRKSSFMSDPVVKRVIATEGQHVTVDYMNHCVLVDGVPLEEPYILELMQDPNRSDMPVVDVTVPEGSIYVLGDNRNHSSDSRDERLGPVELEYIKGKAFYILSPAERSGPVS